MWGRVKGLQRRERRNCVLVDALQVFGYGRLILSERDYSPESSKWSVRMAWE